MTTFIKQIFRYALTGISSVALYVGLLWLLKSHLAVLPVFLSNFFAYSAGTLLNYVMNYYWSFQSDTSHARALSRFLLIVASGVVANTAFVNLLFFQGMRVEHAALLFSALWPLVSFFSLKFWAMR